MGTLGNRGLISCALVAFLTSAATAIPAWTADSPQSSPSQAADIVRDPSDLPPSVGDRAAGVVHVVLSAHELVGVLDASSGTTYRYWTFNGKVPGPFIRVRQGDTVEVTLRNDANDTMVHSIDLHAALGPGGGAAFSQVPPGQAKTFSFLAATPGLYVYHCGTPMVSDHIANGMYGLILVEPPGGLPHVDHEYYVMQGEIYTSAAKGEPGLQQFSESNLMQERPEYFVFNGAVDALSSRFALQANVGETVRIFFGNAGPNATASEHMIGEIFTKVYTLGSLTSPPSMGVQTAGVPPGSAAILELKTEMPGEFTLMDHAMSRMDKGLLAVLNVTGPENTALMHAGPSAPPAGAAQINGMTAADLESATQAPSLTAIHARAANAPTDAGAMAGMSSTAPSTASVLPSKTSVMPAASAGAVVSMGEMSFSPATVAIAAGQQVIWKNTSNTYHNVVDDPSKAVNMTDVGLPSGSVPFSSQLMEPGATFSYVFGKPGIYHYVCVLHESGGMTGTVIVKPGPMIASTPAGNPSGQ